MSRALADESGASWVTTRTSGLSEVSRLAAASTLRRPTSAELYRICRWRLLTSTTSKSTSPRVPTPAAARSNDAGDPGRPAKGRSGVGTRIRTALTCLSFRYGLFVVPGSMGAEPPRPQLARHAAADRDDRVTQVRPRVGEIEGGRLRRVIGMRVIEADNLEAALRRARLSAAIVVRPDEETPPALEVGVVVEAPGVADDPVTHAEQDTAALVGVRGGAVPPDRRPRFHRHPQRCAGRLPERFGQVTTAAVREDGDDEPVVDGAGDLDGGREGRAARRADEQAGFTGKAPRHCMRVFRGDREVAIGQRPNEGSWPGRESFDRC